MSILHTSASWKINFPMYSVIFFVGKDWTENTWLFQQPQVIFLVCFPMIGTFLKQRSISQDIEWNYKIFHERFQGLPKVSADYMKAQENYLP